MGDLHMSGGSWTLLTTHRDVLVAITGSPDARIRDISADVGLTERTVHAIVADLEAAGYLSRTRIGLRSRYTVHHNNLFKDAARDRHRVVRSSPCLPSAERTPAPQVPREWSRDE